MALASTKISAHCRELLKGCSDYAPEYDDGLADHLPMTLIALDYLGASAARLSDFKAHYAERLEPLIVSSPGSSALSIGDCIGRPEYFDACRNLFNEEVARNGQSAVLRRWLPALVPGITASAFHAAIRLAYGIEAGAPGEVSSGLAFWATTYRPLGALGETADENLLEIASRCSADTLAYEFKSGRIVDRMAELSNMGLHNLTRSQPRSISLEDIARFSLADLFRGCALHTPSYGDGLPRISTVPAVPQRPGAKSSVSLAGRSARVPDDQGSAGYGFQAF